MTGEEMIQEIDRREYYARKERKNAELVDCMVYAAIWLIIAGGLLSIAGHVRELWQAFEGF